MPTHELPQCELRNRVQVEREARGWSKSELCRRAGISRPTLYAVERQQIVDTPVMLAIARALGVSWRDIWAEDAA